MKRKIPLLRVLFMVLAVHQAEAALAHSSMPFLTRVYQQQVQGRIQQTDGSPLLGVSIKNLRTAQTVQTDAYGKFQISAQDSDSLEISFIGFTTKRISVSGSSLPTLILEPNQVQLADVIVTGYTNYSKKKSSNVSTTVTSKDLEQVPMASLDQVLQGRVPGMSVLSSSGQPGEAASVVIRGVGSINGTSSPLYVIDGVPIDGSDLKNYNPNDFENVTVLRDASAKALYGSRGSNGVIILSSKQGKSGQLKVNYASQYGLSTLTNPKFRMMNSEQRLRFEEEVGLELGEDIGPGWRFSAKNPANAAWTDPNHNPGTVILDSLRALNVDWRDFFFRNGRFMEQQASISGGNENVRFFNSLNYYKQDGIAMRSGMDRYALRSNVDFNSNKFSAGMNISLGYSNSSYTEAVGESTVGSSMASVYYALPYEYPYAPDGTLIHFGNEDKYSILDLREGSAGLERLLNSSAKSDLFNSTIGLNMAYQLRSDLKIHTRLGIDYRNRVRQDYINPDSYYGSRKRSPTIGGKGMFGEGYMRKTGLISTSGITYQKTFDEKHDLEVSGFFEYIFDKYRAFNYIGYGIDGRLPETPAGITVGENFIPALGGGRSQSALVSFMGVARYSYDQKYSLTGSYRYDGSTKVAKPNRWHGFFSLGANWNVKAESFLVDHAFINGLNFRASYGTTASPFSGDFLYLASYATDINYGGQTAIRPVAPGNENFDWEYVDEFNAGMDLQLWASNRFRLTVDYYNKVTKNMFINQPLSMTSGFYELALSTGRMQNRGVEFSVQGDLIKQENFTWTLGLNAGYNKNKILFLTDELDEMLDGDTRILKVGLPYGTYYAPEWAGVNVQNGDAQYYNRDGSITNTYDEVNQSTTKFGSMFPKWVGGISSGIRYQSFTLDALFSFVKDISRWNNEDFYNENPRYMESNQSIRMLENRWKKPGDIADLQRLDVPRQYTSKDIQDASFLRLRNINLAYHVPESALKNIKGIKQVKIFLQAQNLYTWTSWRGLDPENAEGRGRFQYPAPRTYTAGLNVNF